MKHRVWGMMMAAIAMMAAATLGAPARAETKVGSSLESRVTLAFGVEAADLAAWLPAGWAPMAFPKGPFAGANLLLVLIDQHAQVDAEGAPKEPASKRMAILAGLGTQDGGAGVRFYVYQVYASDMTDDPYGNAVLAEISRSASVAADPGDTRRRSELWTVVPSDGEGTLELALEYTGGKRAWAPGGANIFSNRIEGFNRVYRYRQLTELAMSEPLGKPLAGEVRYSTDIPDLAGLLDGSETLLGILDIPVYDREIFLPD